MNFNGQLLLGFSFSSHRLSPPKNPSGHSSPPQGISGLRANLCVPKETFSSIPIITPVMEMSPQRHNPQCGVFAAAMLLLWPVAPGTSVAFPEIPWI